MSDDPDHPSAQFPGKAKQTSEATTTPSTSPKAFQRFDVAAHNSNHYSGVGGGLLQPST
jgi:hypothetical protein